MNVNVRSHRLVFAGAGILYGVIFMVVGAGVGASSIYALQHVRVGIETAHSGGIPVALRFVPPLMLAGGIFGGLLFGFAGGWFVKHALMEPSPEVKR